MTCKSTPIESIKLQQKVKQKFYYDNNSKIQKRVTKQFRNSVDIMIHVACKDHTYIKYRLSGLYFLYQTVSQQKFVTSRNIESILNRLNKEIQFGRTKMYASKGGGKKI
jgi:hypothetical protein